MERNNKEFLIQINEFMRELFPYRVNMERCLKEIKEFKPTNREDKDEISIDEIGIVIDRIFSIVRFLKVNVKYETVLLDSEKVVKLNSKNIKDSVKDSRLWGKNYPKKLYTDLVEVEICTYENMVITLLVIKLEKYIQGLLLEAMELIKSAKDKFSINSIDSFNIQLIEKIEQATNKGENVLSTKEQTELFFKIENLLNKIRSIKSSLLFKECSKKRLIDEDIQLTNIFLKNDEYNYCYKFLLKLNRVFKQNEDIDKYFFNYGVLRLIMALDKYGYKPITSEYCELIYNNGYLLLENVDLFHHDKMMRINSFNNSIQIRVTRPSSDIGETHDLSMNSIIKFIAQIPSEEVVNNFLKEKYEDNYHQALILTASNNGLYKNGVVNISYLNSESNINIKRIVDSFGIKLEGEHSVYSRICPSCGRPSTNIENDEISCNSCDSHWSLLYKDSIEYVWIKRFGK